MPQLVATTILYYIASAGVSITVATQTAIIVGSYILVGGVAVAAGASMVKKPTFGNIQTEASGKLQMSRDTVASRRVVYGTLRVSGPILFASTNGDKNEFLHIIVALAGHEINDVHAIFFNDNIAFLDDVQNTAIYPVDRMTGTYKLGLDSQTAYTMTPATEWGATDVLNGIASVYVRLTADPQVFPNGIPNITATVTGTKLNDADGVTPVGSGSYSNPALIINDYLRNYFGASASEIDSGSFASARDICDQTPFSGSGDFTKRYSCNYSFTLNTQKSKIIEDMLKTCYGKLIYSDGMFSLKVGAFSSPVLSLNENDLIGNINVTTKSSIASSYNSVRGLYIDGETLTSSFQPADFTPVTSSFFLYEDGGVENPVDIELTGVTNHSTARRLAKLNLLDTRQELVVQCTTKAIGLQLVAGDNVSLSLDRYGFVNKVFEVTQLEIQPDLTVNFTLRETASEIYDFPVDEDVDRDLSPNTNLPSPFVVVPPSNFSATEVTTIDADGTVFPAVELNWNSNLTGSISDIEIEYALTSSNDYQVLGKFGRDTTTFTTLDVAAGDTYNFRAQNFNYLGVFSSYVSASLKVLGDTIRPQAPIGGTMTGGTGILQINWTNSAVDTDYRFTQVYIGTSAASASAVDQGRVSGTTFNKTITESATYYGFLKNIDTSGNESDVSSGGNAVVSAIASGSAGPPGPSGSAGFAFTNIYRRSNIVPSGPTYPVGNIPVSGWDLTIPADNGAALWLSSGLISSADNVTLKSGSEWSDPQRVSGRISYFSNDAPVSGSNSSPVDGDIWFDTDDGNRIYRWNGTAWVSVQDQQIPSITGSILTMTSSITSVTSASLANTLNILSATGSIANLYTESFALSSSYGATSASLNNVYATFASQDFAVAVARFSSSVSFMSATSSANAYTDTTLVSYATQTFAQTISQTTSTASFNSATASANARTDTLLTNYATKNESETFSQQSSTASFTSATGSSNAFTLTQLGGYSTTDTSQAYSRQQITASINPGGVVSASNAASVAVNAAAVATLSGSVVNLSAEFGVSVTAGRVTGFKILSSPTVSDFTIQADKFAIVNSSGGSSKAPFIVDGGVTFIDGAVIKSLDAGIITAGTISAAISIDTPQITASAILVTTGLGMRCGNDSSVLTLTGGSVDDDNNGGQIDLVGNDVASIGGVVQLIAGNEATGHILFKTGGDIERMTVYYNGDIGVGAGVIKKITNDDYTVGMYDGSNTIYQQWDGNDYNIKVDATTFTIAREGSDVSFISVNTTSSERYKKNIRNLHGSYELIDMINPVVYDLKDDTKVDQLGFIAEAVYEVLPSLVHKNKEGLVDSLDYSKFTPLLLDCVKQQKKLIEDLEARLSKLENN